MSRNQSQEIFDFIKDNPGACTQDIVDGTGWNRHLVDMAIEILAEQGLIQETGRTEWNDPILEISPI